MDSDAPAILWVMLDVDPVDEDELYRWYDEEHIPIRMDLPGWVRTRRFLHDDRLALEQAGRGRKHLTIYEVASIDAFLTPEYAVQYVEKTSWSAKVVPTQKRVMRCYYRQSGDLPASSLRAEDDASAVVIAMWESRPGVDVEDWLRTEHLPALGAVPGLLRTRSYVRTEVPWPGAKWMQPELGRTHLLVHEFVAVDHTTSPAMRAALQATVALSRADRSSAGGPIVGAFELVAEHDAPSGRLAQTTGSTEAGTRP